MKATITTAIGTFEFEGEDDAVQRQITAILASPVHTDISKTVSKAEQPKRKSTSVKRTTAQPKVLSRLLTTKEEIDGVKAFFAQKSPDSHVEKYAVLTLWLKNYKSLEDVSIDEMWTLYKVIGVKQPKNLLQTFRDGKSKKSYFDLTPDGRYFITPFGETFVDFDLPNKKKEK